MRRYIQIVTPKMNTRKELMPCGLHDLPYQHQGHSKLYSFIRELMIGKTRVLTSNIYQQMYFQQQIIMNLNYLNHSSNYLFDDWKLSRNQLLGDRIRRFSNILSDRHDLIVRENMTKIVVE